MKPQLKINQRDIINPFHTLGMSELLTHLVNSNEFDISYHEERFDAFRGERACLLYYNNKKIYLDLWDYSSPTFTDKILLGNFDLIIKLQLAKTNRDDFNTNCKKINLFQKYTDEDRKQFFDKLVPWIFFYSRLMKPFVGQEYNQVIPIERLGFFCGKGWRCRRRIRASLQKQNIEYINSDQELFQKPLSEPEFINRMQSSKYGIVLHGRAGAFCEAKNRREIDYMMFKKPLLLNYRPHYYNPMEEGKHYIYFNEKTVLTNIEKQYNIDEIASNGYQWYKENASPEGITKSFLKIMKARFNE